MSTTHREDSDFGMPAPNLYIICLWIVALASGRFTQVFGRLKRTDEDHPGDCGFCVTGLACEVVRMLFPDNYGWEDSLDSKFIYNKELEPEASLASAPPTPVREFLMLSKSVEPGPFVDSLRPFTDNGAALSNVKVIHKSENTTLSNLVITANDEGIEFVPLARGLANFYRHECGFHIPPELVEQARQAPANKSLTSIVEDAGITKQMAVDADVGNPVTS